MLHCPESRMANFRPDRVGGMAMSNSSELSVSSRGGDGDSLDHAAVQGIVEESPADGSGAGLRARLDRGDRDDGVRARRGRRPLGAARAADPGGGRITSTTASTTTATHAHQRPQLGRSRGRAGLRQSHVAPRRPAGSLSASAPGSRSTARSISTTAARADAVVVQVLERDRRGRLLRDSAPGHSSRRAVASWGCDLRVGERGARRPPAVRRARSARSRSGAGRRPGCRPPRTSGAPGGCDLRAGRSRFRARPAASPRPPRSARLRARPRGAVRGPRRRAAAAAAPGRPSRLRSGDG